jgi:hypothetical protein
MRAKPRQEELQAEVSGDLGRVYGPVRPSGAFRQHLSANLLLAAQRKVTGEPVIEPSPLLYRTLGLVAGIIGIIGALLAALLYWLSDRRRESASSASGRA